MFGKNTGLLFEIGSATGGSGGGEELGVFFGFGEAVGLAARAFLFMFLGGCDGSCGFGVRRKGCELLKGGRTVVKQ